MVELSPQVLIADDDPEIRKLLARYVQGQSFRVKLASSCADVRQRLATDRIDLVVLDVMLPDGSGLDLCRDLRSERNRVPIILLTALKEDIDRILGLEMGADDYLGKPFNPRELVARIRAVLRRRTETGEGSVEPKRYEFEGFVVDPQMRHLYNQEGALVELTGAEFELLRSFLERPGRVLTREQLVDLTHNRHNQVNERSIDVLVSRLRRKLGSSRGTDLFKTIRNGGYQLAAKVDVYGAEQ